MFMENKKKTKAVLLMAYGSPETKEDVAAYFTHIRGGVRPKEEHIANLKQRYEAVGGKTPLYSITKNQAHDLQKKLDERHGVSVYKVFIGMKHWHPFIKDVLAKIRKESITEVVAIALAPHYSKISIGGYQKALDEAGDGLNIKLVEHWHDNKHLLKCIEEQIEAALKKKDFETRPHIVFTAHSLPVRIREWNDPYEKQLLETSRLVAEKFPEHEWSFSFQSEGHTGEPWLGPDILATLKELKAEGKENVLISSIGFVADHLEILFDLDIEVQEEARKLGMHVERTESRNTHPLFIEALSDLV
jgi:ferrochelatase